MTCNTAENLFERDIRKGRISGKCLKITIEFRDYEHMINVPFLQCRTVYKIGEGSLKTVLWILFFTDPDPAFSEIRIWMKI